MDRLEITPKGKSKVKSIMNQYLRRRLLVSLPFRSWLLLVALGFSTSCMLPAMAQDARDRDASGSDPFSDQGFNDSEVGYARGNPQERYLPPNQRPPTNFKLGIYSRNTPTGVLVTSVVPGSVAQQSGIEAQDNIIAVGGYQVGIVGGRTFDIAEELTRRVDAQGRVTLLVQNHRNSQLVNIPVQFYGAYSANRTVVGTVNTGSRELALPGSLLIVRLMDTSFPQWQNVTIAETQLPVTGRWPLSYRLDFDASNIRPDHRYAVDAKITQRGVPVVETPSPVPVGVTVGNGTANLTLVPSVPSRPSPTVNPTQPNLGRPIDQVSSYYMQLLGRPLNDREQTVWQRELAKGKTTDEILATVLCSSEYYDRYRGNVDLYITEVYQYVLGRNPAPQEVRAIRSQMALTSDLRYPVILSLVRQRNR